MSDLLAEIRVAFIFVGDRAERFGPADVESRIVPPQASGRRGVVECRDLIKNLRVLLQGLKSVSETLRYIEHREVFAGAKLAR